MANNLFSLRGRRPNVNLLLSQPAFTCPKLTSETVEQTFKKNLKHLFFSKWFRNFIPEGLNNSVRHQRWCFAKIVSQKRSTVAAPLVSKQVSVFRHTIQTKH